MIERYDSYPITRLLRKVLSEIEFVCLLRFPLKSLIQIKLILAQIDSGGALKNEEDTNKAGGKSYLDKQEIYFNETPAVLIAPLPARNETLSNRGRPR